MEYINHIGLCCKQFLFMVQNQQKMSDDDLLNAPI